MFVFRVFLLRPLMPSFCCPFVRLSLCLFVYLLNVGEEDPELKRGRPLHLDMERYELLRQEVAREIADHDTRVLA